MSFPRILVVDDNATTREALRELLVDEGYPVEAAADGAAALAMIHRRPPDVILSDLQMPNMTGQQLLGRLREAGIDIPVVIITAEPEADIGDLEAIDVLFKPLDFDAMLARIAAIAGEDNAPSTPNGAGPAGPPLVRAALSGHGA